MAPTRSSRRIRAPPPETENTPSLGSQELLDTLTARIAQLEAQRSRPVLGVRRINFGSTFQFDGSHDEAIVEAFISKINDLIELNAVMLSEPLNDNEKIILARQHFADGPIRDHDIRKGQPNPPATYQEFINWIRTHYVSRDIIAKYRHEYRRCRQRQDETLEKYYRRFMSLANRMDIKSEESLQASDFVDGLNQTQREKLYLPRHGQLSKNRAPRHLRTIELCRKVGKEGQGKPWYPKFSVQEIRPQSKREFEQ